MNLREIDRLVAEKVMGWEEVKENDFIKRPDVDFIGKAPDRFCEDAWSILPNYSTDISDAWEVVEQLREKELYVDIDTFAEHYDVRVVSGPYEVGHSLSETAPLAICLAALKAVGIEVKTE